MLMPSETSLSATRNHVEITQLLLRLYTLLGQALDRCLDERKADGVSEEDFQGHLKAARTETLGMLSVNRVVQEKVEHECARGLSLRSAYFEADAASLATVIKDMRAERNILKSKTMALSDLLAVFRSS